MIICRRHQPEGGLCQEDTISWFCKDKTGSQDLQEKSRVYSFLGFDDLLEVDQPFPVDADDPDGRRIFFVAVGIGV